MSQDKTVAVNSNQESLPTTEKEDSLPAASAFNPMLPWLNMMPNIHIEYRQIEIRLQGEGAKVSGRRASYRDGVINEESINIQGPAQLYFDTAQQFQQQMQNMMSMMLMPWTGAMLQKKEQSNKQQ
ncbi:MAG: hypothetical protein K6L74_13350 [Neptuniibacter sp.]